MKHEQDILSFQLIGPYLKKFTDQNPESVVRLERDAGNHIERVFICPGIMKTTLRYVRPMVSLDAAHLWSKWGGTLYIASVLTGCNEIYPVAIAIMKENENNDGWEWFLNLLHHSSVDLLVMEHPRLRVRFKHFTFISDRQKGLTPALARVFPENHSCFCAIHIARNVEKKVGKKLAKNVYALSTMFSHREAAELLGGIARVSTTGREYLESIPPEQWRSTAWLDDQTLPPRFGIVTTNMSESANSMFEKSRDGSWLECLDTTLAKMVERISTLREKHRGKTGVIEQMLGLLQRRWERCAGFRVLQLQENGSIFTVTRPSRGALIPMKSYTIDVINCTCECGKWQEHGVPCIDAMAYYRLHCLVTLQQVVVDQVDKNYTYGNVLAMLRTNLVPVCLETISPDGDTLPPATSMKRRAGRPKNVRLRQRSRWAHEPEKSNIICSRCGKRGHNVRTCLIREALGKETVVVVSNDSHATTNRANNGTNGEEDNGRPRIIEDLDIS